MANISKNKPCPCGSNKKFKRCCGGKPSEEMIEKLKQYFAPENMSVREYQCPNCRQQNTYQGNLKFAIGFIYRCANCSTVFSEADRVA